MKVKFSKERKYIPEWNGNLNLPEADQVYVIIKPIKLGDLITVMDAIARVGIKAGELNASALEANATKMITALNDAAPIITKHCTLFGLSGDDGEITIQQTAENMQFFPLFSEIMAKAIEFSQPDAVTEKN